MNHTNHSSVFFLLWRSHGRALLLMTVLSVLSGVAGIGVLAYINRFLQQSGSEDSLLQFVLLVLLYFAATAWTQIWLSQTGHRFVAQMQRQLVKQIMDTDSETLARAGKAKILASLGSDIRTLSIAFTRLPEWVQGVLFTVACAAYLLWLSPVLFAVTAVLLGLMVAVSHLIVKRHYRYFHKMRRSEDALYRHYGDVLDGHKELLLNRYRAERFFRDEFSVETENKRSAHTKADAYHLLAVNWSNSVMLAAVGIVFYLAARFGWVSGADAATIGMTVLFMRGPLTAAVGAFPVIMQGRVAFQALSALRLPPYQIAFHQGGALPQDWREIRFENVRYAYPAQSGQKFALEPVNLTLKRGETVFLIGANGSGKSTLSMLLCGLYPPVEGRIWVDGVEINAQNRSVYRQLFAAVFTDFHLFEQLLDGYGGDVSDGLLQAWLGHLQLANKVKIEAGRVMNGKLSQGQRKRLALLSAALEGRSMLVLDEWAADQDPQFRRVFYEQLLPLLKAGGYTVFAVSHDDKYFHYADRILSMKQGVLSEYGAAEAVGVAEAHSRLAE